MFPATMFIVTTEVLTGQIPSRGLIPGMWMDPWRRFGTQVGLYPTHNFPCICPSFLLLLCHYSTHPLFPASPCLPQMAFNLVAAAPFQDLPSAPMVSEAHAVGWPTPDCPSAQHGEVQPHPTG